MATASDQFLNRRQHHRPAGILSNAVRLISCLAIAGGLIYAALIIRGAIPHFSDPLKVTPARGTAKVQSYQVAAVIPCGSLALVNVLVRVNVSDHLLIFGAHVNATLPVQEDICVGGSIPATAKVAGKKVVVTVPALHPVSTGIDDLSTAGSGGLGTDFWGATPGMVQDVEHDSGAIAQVSAELAPLPVNKQRTIILTAELQALPGLRQRFHTDAVTFTPVTTESAFDQMLADWRTFGPEIRRDFTSTHFSSDGQITELALTAKNGSGGTVYIDQHVTNVQLRDLNAAVARGK